MLIQLYRIYTTQFIQYHEQPQRTIETNGNKTPRNNNVLCNCNTYVEHQFISSMKYNSEQYQDEVSDDVYRHPPLHWDIFYQVSSTTEF